MNRFRVPLTLGAMTLVLAGCYESENNASSDSIEQTPMVLAGPTVAEGKPPDAVAIQVSDDINDSTSHFQRHLERCGPNEIRCLWFLDDRRNVGMVMTIDLQESTVFQVREVYNGAAQNSRRHDLTPAQVLSLLEVVKQLPASDESVEFNKRVSVSVQREGKVEMFHYDRRNAPEIIHRLYHSAGGRFDGQNAD